MKKCSPEPGFTENAIPDRLKRPFDAVVIGVSMGGVEALSLLLGALPGDCPWPILIVQHISPESDNGLSVLLDTRCALRVKEADEGDALQSGTVYLAHANYHLLVGRDNHLALSVDPPVCFARPSIDMLFESAAEVFQKGLIGVVLTGANFDGSAGLSAVKRLGGLTIVQDPKEAVSAIMPKAAIAAAAPDYVLALADIAALLCTVAEMNPRNHPPKDQTGAEIFNHAV